MKHFMSVACEFKGEKATVNACGVWRIPLDEELVVGCETHQQLTSAIQDLEVYMMAKFGLPRTAIWFAPFTASEPLADVICCFVARSGEYSRQRFTLEHVKSCPQHEGVQHG